MSDPKLVKEMLPSYQRINYGLRPNKVIERKYICEVLRKLSPFGEVEKYRYIGFGSTYFTDFNLFHKNLNIKNMISIEHDIKNQDRFSFNVPYKCIDIKYGESSDILPTLKWDTRSVVWLDYDSPLSDSILSDIFFLCSRLLEGSLLIVTIDSEPEQPTNDVRDFKDIEEFRKKKIYSRINRKYIPPNVNAKELGTGLTNLYWRIIIDVIQKAILERNGARSAGNKLIFNQVFNIVYADGARMLTVGGIVYDEGQVDKFRQCNFQNLKIFSDNSCQYNIRSPKLTFKEIGYLNKKLPNEDIKQLYEELKMIPEEDVEKYSEVYRYFPVFTEAEF
jgi:hypothetical protein